jgi:hypothetical protein
MPRTLAKLLPVIIGVASFGLGVVGSVFASGVRVGAVETRVMTLEQCAVDAAEVDTEQDARLRQVEMATAVLPGMAEDIREIREMLNLLASHQPDRS